MGYYLLVIGAVISGFGFWVFIKSVQLLVLGVRTRGVIVGVDEQLRRGNGERKKVYFHPVIEFETAKDVRFSSRSEADQLADGLSLVITLRSFMKLTNLARQRFIHSSASGQGHLRHYCLVAAVSMAVRNWCSSRSVDC